MDKNTNTRQLRRERRADALAEYTELSKKISSLRRDEDLKNVQVVIKNCLHRSGELYPIVKKRLDGTAADSRHVKGLLNLGKEASKRINTVSKPFDLAKIIRNLRREHSNTREFNRFIVQNYVSEFLCNPPTFGFFYGTLYTDDLVIKGRRKRNREKIVEGRAVTAEERDIKIDLEYDSTPKEVEHLEKQINELATEELPFFGTLVDPKSFIQTVQNLFHISFLVKEGKVGVEPNESQGALLTVGQGASNANSQSVLSFSMEDYRTWVANFGIKKSVFKPRTVVE